jgi:hypothetical protein
MIDTDRYKDQLAKKNGATVNFRAKQLELKRLYTFESVFLQQTAKSFPLSRKPS